MRWAGIECRAASSFPFPFLQFFVVFFLFCFGPPFIPRNFSGLGSYSSVYLIPLIHAIPLYSPVALACSHSEALADDLPLPTL